MADCAATVSDEGDTSFSRESFGREHESKKFVRKALKNPGSPKGCATGVSELGLCATEAAKDLVALILHLPDPTEQAAVLRTLANATQGALMGHAVEAFDRAVAEQDAVEEAQQPGYAVLCPSDVAADMIAVEHRMSCTTAKNFLWDSTWMHKCLPRVWNLIIEGVIPKWVGDIIVRETSHVTDPARLANIEAQILKCMAAKGGTSHWNGYLTRCLRGIVAEVDPDAVTRKAEGEERARDVELRNDQPGMATLAANLPALDAEAVMAAVNALAESWAECPGERRCASERRADALVHLTTGIDKSPPGWESPEASASPITVEPRITLIGDGSALSDLNRVWIGTNTVARRKLDEFLQQCRRSRIESVPVESAACDTSPEEIAAMLAALTERLRTETTYQPSAALRRAVMERDGTCRHPGCSVPARRCDLDHVRPYDHANPTRGGLTREDNLICLCRKHHRLKTHGNAQYTLHPDGRVTVRIGSLSVGESVPTGPRGTVRTINAMEYATNPERYCALLRQVCQAAAELNAELNRVADGAASDAAPAPDTDRRPRATSATRRQQQTAQHRQRTAAERAAAAAQRAAEEDDDEIPF